MTTSVEAASVALLLQLTCVCVHDAQRADVLPARRMTASIPCFIGRFRRRDAEFFRRRRRRRRPSSKSVGATRSNLIFGQSAGLMDDAIDRSLVVDARSGGHRPSVASIRPCVCVCVCLRVNGRLVVHLPMKRVIGEPNARAAVLTRHEIANTSL